MRGNRLSSSETGSPDDKNRPWEPFDAFVACLTGQSCCIQESRVEDGRGCSEHKARGPVSHPRSSNPACGFPAPGFPTGFFVGSTQSFRDCFTR